MIFEGRPDNPQELLLAFPNIDLCFQHFSIFVPEKGNKLRTAIHFLVNPSFHSLVILFKLASVCI